MPKKCNLGPVSVVLLLAVVACRGETTPLVNPPTSSPLPIRTAIPNLEATPSPTDAVETPAGLAPSPEAPCFSGNSIEEQVRAALAEWPGISSEEIEVVEVEEVEWRDTSLGCPQPGIVYAQVIVPGYKVVMRVDDEVYEYHHGVGHGVLCDQEGHLITVPPSPTVTPITVPSAPTLTIEDVCPMLLVFPHGRVCPTPWTPHNR